MMNGREEIVVDRIEEKQDDFYAPLLGLFFAKLFPNEPPDRIAKCVIEAYEDLEGRDNGDS